MESTAIALIIAFFVVIALWVIRFIFKKFFFFIFIAATAAFLYFYLS